MAKRLNDFLKDESGASAIEYAVIMLLIGIACIGGFTMTGNAVNTSLANTANSFPG